MKLLTRKYLCGIFLNSGRKVFSILLVSLSILLLFSCAPAKNTTYFANISDSQLVKLPDFTRPEPIIMPDDMLEIKIAGGNEVTTQVFNSFGGISAAGGIAGIPVYTVDGNGDIEFPYLGKVQAAGLTKETLKAKLKTEVSKYLKDVLISVRFYNFRFTVLGEVRVPGSYVLPSDKVTVLEALGQAGDMTQYAFRTHVRIIRDSSGKREIGKMDFTQKDLFTSPFFYLQRNDVVYVEPDKVRSRNEQFSRASTIVSTLASLIAISLAVFRK